MNESRWVEISFLCLSYDTWAGKSLGSGRNQPWLWAFNAVQSFKEVTEASSLAAHDHYGYFSLPMTGHDLNEEKESPSIPSIDQSLPNRKEDDSGQELNRTSRSTWVQIHGSLLVLGFMILYPCGAVVIRSGSKASFKIHLFLQLSASLCCLVGAAVALLFANLINVVCEDIQAF